MITEKRCKLCVCGGGGGGGGGVRAFQISGVRNMVSSKTVAFCCSKLLPQ